MGSHDYQWFYHTSSEDLVWLDKKGNPIPLLHACWTCMLKQEMFLICGTPSKHGVRSIRKIYQPLVMAPQIAHLLMLDAPIVNDPNKPHHGVPYWR